MFLRDFFLNILIFVLLTSVSHSEDARNSNYVKYVRNLNRKVGFRSGEHQRGNSKLHRRHRPLPNNDVNLYRPTNSSKTSQDGVKTLPERVNTGVNLYTPTNSSKTSQDGIKTLPELVNNGVNLYTPTNSSKTSQDGIKTLPELVNNGVNVYKPTNSSKASQDDVKSLPELISNDVKLYTPTNSSKTSQDGVKTLPELVNNELNTAQKIFNAAVLPGTIKRIPSPKLPHRRRRLIRLRTTPSPDTITQKEDPAITRTDISGHLVRNEENISAPVEKSVQKEKSSDVSNTDLTIDKIHQLILGPASTKKPHVKVYPLEPRAEVPIQTTPPNLIHNDQISSQVVHSKRKPNKHWRSLKDPKPTTGIIKLKTALQVLKSRIRHRHPHVEPHHHHHPNHHYHHHYHHHPHHHHGHQLLRESAELRPKTNILVINIAREALNKLMHGLIQSGNNVIFKEDPCLSSPCMNGGKCHRDITRSFTKYTCTCFFGYDGPRCGTYILRHPIHHHHTSHLTIFIIIGIVIAILSCCLIHACRVWSRRSDLKYNYKNLSKSGLDPPEVPTTLEIWNQMCLENFCGCFGHKHFEKDGGKYPLITKKEINELVSASQTGRKSSLNLIRSKLEMMSPEGREVVSQHLLKRLESLKGASQKASIIKYISSRTHDRSSQLLLKGVESLKVTSPKTSVMKHVPSKTQDQVITSKSDSSQLISTKEKSSNQSLFKKSSVHSQRQSDSSQNPSKKTSEVPLTDSRSVNLEQLEESFQHLPQATSTQIVNFSQNRLFTKPGSRERIQYSSPQLQKIQQSQQDQQSQQSQQDQQFLKPTQFQQSQQDQQFLKFQQSQQDLKSQQFQRSQQDLKSQQFQQSQQDLKSQQFQRSQQDQQFLKSQQFQQSQQDLKSQQFQRSQQDQRFLKSQQFQQSQLEHQLQEAQQYQHSPQAQHLQTSQQFQHSQPDQQFQQSQLISEQRHEFQESRNTRQIQQNDKDGMHAKKEMFKSSRSSSSDEANMDGEDDDDNDDDDDNNEGENGSTLSPEHKALLQSDDLEKYLVDLVVKLSEVEAAVHKLEDKDGQMENQNTEDTRMRDGEAYSEDRENAVSQSEQQQDFTQAQNQSGDTDVSTRINIRPIKDAEIPKYTSRSYNPTDYNEQTVPIDDPRRDIKRISLRTIPQEDEPTSEDPNEDRAQGQSFKNATLIETDDGYRVNEYTSREQGRSSENITARKILDSPISRANEKSLENHVSQRKDEQNIGVDLMPKGQRRSSMNTMSRGKLVRNLDEDYQSRQQGRCSENAISQRNICNNYQSRIKGRSSENAMTQEMTEVTTGDHFASRSQILSPKNVITQDIIVGGIDDNYRSRQQERSSENAISQRKDEQNIGVDLTPKGQRRSSMNAMSRGKLERNLDEDYQSKRQGRSSENAISQRNICNNYQYRIKGRSSENAMTQEMEEVNTDDHFASRRQIHSPKNVMTQDIVVGGIDDNYGSRQQERSFENAISQRMDDRDTGDDYHSRGQMRSVENAMTPEMVGRNIGEDYQSRRHGRSFEVSITQGINKRSVSDDYQSRGQGRSVDNASTQDIVEGKRSNSGQFRGPGRSIENPMFERLQDRATTNNYTSKGQRLSFETSMLQGMNQGTKDDDGQRQSFENSNFQEISEGNVEDDNTVRGAQTSSRNVNTENIQQSNASPDTMEMFRYCPYRNDFCIRSRYIPPTRLLPSRDPPPYRTSHQFQRSNVRSNHRISGFHGVDRGGTQYSKTNPQLPSTSQTEDEKDPNITTTNESSYIQQIRKELKRAHPYESGTDTSDHGNWSREQMDSNHERMNRNQSHDTWSRKTSRITLSPRSSPYASEGLQSPENFRREFKAIVRREERTLTVQGQSQSDMQQDGDVFVEPSSDDIPAPRRTFPMTSKFLAGRIRSLRPPCEDADDENEDSDMNNSRNLDDSGSFFCPTPTNPMFGENTSNSNPFFREDNTCIDSGLCGCSITQVDNESEIIHNRNDKVSGEVRDLGNIIDLESQNNAFSNECIQKKRELLDLDIKIISDACADVDVITSSKGHSAESPITSIRPNSRKQNLNLGLRNMRHLPDQKCMEGFSLREESVMDSGLKGVVVSSTCDSSAVDTDIDESANDNLDGTSMVVDVGSFADSDQDVEVIDEEISFKVSRLILPKNSELNHSTDDVGDAEKGVNDFHDDIRNKMKGVDISHEVLIDGVKNENNDAENESGVNYSRIEFDEGMNDANLVPSADESEREETPSQTSAQIASIIEDIGSLAEVLNDINCNQKESEEESELIAEVETNSNNLPVCMDQGKSTKEDVVVPIPEKTLAYSDIPISASDLSKQEDITIPKVNQKIDESSDNI